jgi:allophanate hydrolase
MDADTAQARLTEVYRRIAEAGERPVWISLVPEAQAQSRLVDARRRADAGEILPLLGVTFAVKDNIDVAGLPTTAACPDFAYVPERSAAVVERLEAVGAILVGKTNLDQFATGLVGTRSPYGICASVFDPAYISGGSSAGSAVAVASGLVEFALGTDTAGSGRVPAAFNNIAGLKPTKGLISTRGVVPACRSQDCVSIFAGSAGAAFRVLEVAQGFDPADPYSRKPPGGAVAPEALPDSFRFGIPGTGLEFFGDAEAEARYWESVERLQSLGGIRVEIDFAPFQAAARLLYEGPWVAERLAALRAFGFDKPDAMDTVVRDIILGAGGITASDAFTAFYRLAELVRAAEAEWTRMDVLLLPTTGTTYTIDSVLADPVRLNSNLGLYTNFVNLMDLSAIAVPAGFRPGGLPFGVTLIGRAFEDGKIAVIADRLHRAVDGATVGATGLPLPGEKLVPRARPARVVLAVVGAHLTGQPLNWQLTDRKARLLETTRTASGYRLYALDTKPPKPGLIRDEDAAGGIEVELWELDFAGFGSFVADIPPPLGIGTLTLADGRQVKGFICEPCAITGAVEITRYAGWRNWLGWKAAPT